jgi:hypothetical protein
MMLAKGSIRVPSRPSQISSDNGLGEQVNATHQKSKPRLPDSVMLGPGMLLRAGLPRIVDWFVDLIDDRLLLCH